MILTAESNPWDFRLLDVANLVAQWSKDPSTKTGAVIVDDERRIIATGFNGFPRGVVDSKERYADRELKYSMIVHCERNAILFARESLKGCTLYTYPFLSCSVCAGMVIQAGISRCVCPVCPPDKLARWGDSFKLTEQMFTEAGVIFEYAAYDITPIHGPR